MPYLTPPEPNCVCPKCGKYECGHTQEEKEKAQSKKDNNGIDWVRYHHELNNRGEAENEKAD